MPTGSVGSMGTSASRVECSFFTLLIWGSSSLARSRRRSEVGAAAARELLTTHAQGWICARSRSACNSAASDRCGLGEGDEDDLGLLGILQTHEWSGEVHALAHVAGDVAVVGAGGVEQKQGVAGGCGVDHHERSA